MDVGEVMGSQYGLKSILYQMAPTDKGSLYPPSPGPRRPKAGVPTPATVAAWKRFVKLQIHVRWMSAILLLCTVVERAMKIQKT